MELESKIEMRSYGMRAIQIIDQLHSEPGDKPRLLSEASVYLPPRSTRWVAVFTGPEPGKQVKRSTGLTDRVAALALAKKWEREARAERARTSAPRKPTSRAGAHDLSGLLTQNEVAAIMGMSVRGVRELERRAFGKLRQNPDLRRVWKEYELGQMAESDAKAHAP